MQNGQSDFVPQIHQTRHNDDHLRILQAIYGILISFGLREIVEAVVPWASSWPNSPSGYLVLLCGINLLALALRFFFIIEEISRYLLFVKANKLTVSARVVTLFHYPMVILQACLFYALTAFFRKSALSGDLPSLNLAEFRIVVLIQAALLVTNVCWLLRVRQKRRGHAELKTDFETRWILINAICAALVIAICVYSPNLTLAYSVLSIAIFIAGSLADLWNTAEFYIPKV